MKKLQFLVCFLLLSVASYAAERTIQLPKPDMNRAGLLMKALSERHSTREYASKALSNTDLSDLLWAANGINRSSEGKRTAPSAMNRQDIDIYVVLPQGTYLYDAKGHKLNLISEEITVLRLLAVSTLSTMRRYRWCWSVICLSWVMRRVIMFN